MPDAEEGQLEDRWTDSERVCGPPSRGGTKAIPVLRLLVLIGKIKIVVQEDRWKIRIVVRSVSPELRGGLMPPARFSPEEKPGRRCSK